MPPPEYVMRPKILPSGATTSLMHEPLAFLPSLARAKSCPLPHPAALLLNPRFFKLGPPSPPLPLSSSFSTSFSPLLVHLIFVPPPPRPLLVFIFCLLIVIILVFSLRGLSVSISLSLSLSLSLFASPFVIVYVSVLTRLSLPRTATGIPRKRCNDTIFILSVSGDNLLYDTSRKVSSLTNSEVRPRIRWTDKNHCTTKM
jgi:hypothetical protein